MKWQSLGKVTTTVGVPVRLTANRADPTASFPVFAILCEVLRGNTKAVHILDSATARNASTEANTLATIPVPTLTTGEPIVLPSASASIPNFPYNTSHRFDGFDASKQYLDVEVDGEGAIISVITAD